MDVCNMGFYKEPVSYEKTILSDLQGMWDIFRSEVLSNIPNINCTTLMFHIDEAMSWESVRNLEHMRKTLILIRNIITKEKFDKNIHDILDDLQETLDKAIETQG